MQQTQCRGISSIILYNHVKLYSDERGQKSHAPKIQLITTINQSPFMDAGSHTSHRDAHVTASQTLRNYHTSCIKMVIFLPLALPNERQTAVKKLIPCPQWWTERTFLEAAICAGLGPNDCKRLCDKLDTELRIEAGDPGSCTHYTSAAGSASLTTASSHPGHWGTQLDLDGARGRVVRLHLGTFHQLRCKSPVLETMKQLELQLLLQYYTPALSLSIFMPGILEEFAFRRLKRKKNEKDKGKGRFGGGVGEWERWKGL